MSTEYEFLTSDILHQDGLQLNVYLGYTTRRPKASAAARPLGDAYHSRFPLPCSVSSSQPRSCILQALAVPLVAGLASRAGLAACATGPALPAALAPASSNAASGVGGNGSRSRVRGLDGRDESRGRRGGHWRTAATTG